jgi:hypothetical protein
MKNGEWKVRFDLISEDGQSYVESCYAYASPELTLSELHSQNGYRVRLLVQGIYVIWTGQTLLFFSKREHRHAPVKPLRRLVLALGYLLPLGVIAMLIATAINSNDIALLRAFFVDNAGMVFWTSVVALGGTLLMVWPAKMLANTFRERPELAVDRRALVTARLIGVCGLLVAIYIFSRL